MLLSNSFSFVSLSAVSLTADSLNGYNLLTLNGLTAYELNGLVLVALFSAIGALMVVRGLGCGACVSVPHFSHTYKGEKIGLSSYGWLSPSVLMCQFAYTLGLSSVVAWFASGSLHVGTLARPLVHLYAHTLTDPHPLNFGFSSYIHPTLTQTTFPPSIWTCPLNQHAMEA